MYACMYMCVCVHACMYSIKTNSKYYQVYPLVMVGFKQVISTVIYLGLDSGGARFES